MHFQIIAIESLETDKIGFKQTLNEDDSTLNANCDYYGEIYNSKERKEIIESEWLKNFLKGIAEVNTEEETITFFDEKTINDTLNKYFLKLTLRLLNLAVDNTLEIVDLSEAAKDYKNDCALFYWNDCGYTSLEFVEEASYNAGKTVRIGNIFDAHC